MLIENLLTTSKIQAQRTLELNLDDVRLDQLAARAVERFSTQTKKHQFKLNFPPDFPVIQGDEQRLRQVLDNLLSNAIKYSPDGGLIEVGGIVDDRSVTVYVRDQGVGLSESDQERVFDRFYRVDGTLSRRTQGTGLGLFLAKVDHRGARRDRCASKANPDKAPPFTLRFRSNSAALNDLTETILCRDR